MNKEFFSAQLMTGHTNHNIPVLNGLYSVKLPAHLLIKLAAT